MKQKELKKHTVKTDKYMRIGFWCKVHIDEHTAVSLFV